VDNSTYEAAFAGALVVVDDVEEEELELELDSLLDDAVVAAGVEAAVLFELDRLSVR
jgi:hypothetical protein